MQAEAKQGAAAPANPSRLQFQVPTHTHTHTRMREHTSEQPYHLRLHHTDHTDVGVRPRHRLQRASQSSGGAAMLSAKAVHGGKERPCHTSCQQR